MLLWRLNDITLSFIWSIYILLYIAGSILGTRDTAAKYNRTKMKDTDHWGGNICVETMED